MHTNVTFQYFFFDTYPGYFLQILPLSLLAGAVCWLLRRRAGRRGSLWPCLFTAYLAGLVGLVLLLDVISDTWYWLLYRYNEYDFSRFFSFAIDLVPSFWRGLNAERIGNVLLFLPFGILYPLARENVSLGGVLRAGALCTVCMELLQPVFGRVLDVNDILLNLAGVGISASAFFAIRRFCRRIRGAENEIT